MKPCPFPLLAAQSKVGSENFIILMTAQPAEYFRAKIRDQLSRKANRRLCDHAQRLSAPPDNPGQLIHGRDFVPSLPAKKPLAVFKCDTEIQSPVDYPTVYLMLKEREEAWLKQDLFHQLSRSLHFENDGVVSQIDGFPADTVGGALRCQGRQQCSQAIQNRFPRGFV